MADVAPIPKLSFSGGTQASRSFADSFTSAGAFGDFYFGGSGAGVGQPASNISTVVIFAIVVLAGVALWKIKGK